MDAVSELPETSKKKKNEAEEFRMFLDYCEHWESEKAAREICELVGHTEITCTCTKPLRPFEPPNNPYHMLGPHGGQYKERPGSCYSTIFTLGSKTEDIVKIDPTKNCARSLKILEEENDEKKDSQTLEKRRKLKTKIFLNFGIVRSNDGVNVKKVKTYNEDTKKDSLVSTYCSLCCQNFSSSKMLLLHNTKQHNRPCMECHICGTTCKTTVSFHKHMKSHSNNFYFNISCDLCERKFKNKKMLKIHLEVEHKKELKNFAQISKEEYQDQE